MISTRRYFKQKSNHNQPNAELTHSMIIFSKKYKISVSIDFEETLTHIVCRYKSKSEFLLQSELQVIIRY